MGLCNVPMFMALLGFEIGMMRDNLFMLIIIPYYSDCIYV